MMAGYPYKVAILDDDTFHRKIIESFCEGYSWIRVRSFADPGEAMESIRQERIPIVLVDINMPGIYGDDVLRHCMSLKQGIQVYVITGAENMVLASRCLELGARIVIRKPVTQQSIEEALTDARMHLDRSAATIKAFARKKMEA